MLFYWDSNSKSLDGRSIFSYPVIQPVAHIPILESNPSTEKALIWPAKSSRFLKTKAPRLVIDGLLGLGATPPPRPAEAAILNWISNEKRNSDLYVALDLPSGLNPTSGATPGAIFPADLTLALGSVKSGCLKDSALPHVGQLRGVTIEFTTPAPKSSVDFFLPQEAYSILRSRPPLFINAPQG